MSSRSFSTFSQTPDSGRPRDSSSVLQKSAMLSPKKIGDYELLAEIGRGGMGIVYRARQTFLNQSVAIKILTDRHTDDSLVISRFRREMQMIGRLDHPNIVRALNAGESQGTLYLVMEFVEGINLAKLVRLQQGSGTSSLTESQVRSFLGIGTAAEIIRQALLGLDHASHLGLVHRDIKPANLMLTKSGTVKILDLGLGKFLADNQLAGEDIRECAQLTQIGTTVGTIDYIAPEQCENAADVDVRADIYALGCTLFFLLTGEAPFDGPDYSSVRKKLLAHLNGNIPPIRRFRSDCPDELQQILTKMVDPNPDDRFQTPAEVLEVITPFARFSDLFALLSTLPEPNPTEISSSSDSRSIDSNDEQGLSRTFGSRTSSSSTLQSLSARSRVNQMNPELKRILGSSALLLLVVGMIVLFLVRSENETAKPDSKTTVSQKKNILPNDQELGPNDKESRFRNQTVSNRGQEQHPVETLERVSGNADLGQNERTGNLTPTGTIQVDRTGQTDETSETPSSDSIQPELSSQHELVSQQDPTFQPELSTTQKRVMRDLVQLPGLGGAWSHSEIPWYLPFLRDHLARSIQSGSLKLEFLPVQVSARISGPTLSSPSEMMPRPKIASNGMVVSDVDLSLNSSLSSNHDISVETSRPSDSALGKGGLPYYDPNIVNVYRFIWNTVQPIVETMPDYRKKLVKMLKETLETRIEKEQLFPLYVDALLQFEKNSDPNSATDLHTIALLQHQIALLKNDVSIAEEARESYQRAIREYSEDEKSGDWIASLLKSVGRSDWARLEYWSENDYAKFERLARLILQTSDVSDLFRIEFLTVLGTNSVSSGQNDDRLFEEARVLLEQSGLDPLVHPLSGYIRERLAWSLADQCKFQEAGQKFTEALRIRENNRDQSHNPFAAINVFHNLHGLALIKRYLGDTDGATQGFSDVIEQVKAELDQPEFDEPTQLRYFQDLRERLYNSQERFGDCTLYGGAAGFGASGSNVSMSDLTNAARLYERALQANENKSTRLVLSCKLSITLSLLGQREEAKRVLAESDQTGIIPLGTERRRAAFLRQIADAVLLLKENEVNKNETGITQGRESLRRFLLQFSDSSEEGAKFRRETLELQLFCIELLLNSQLESGQFVAARNDLSFLDPLLLSFVNTKITRPYLRRYYDLAIRCFNEIGESQESDSGFSEQSLIANQLRYLRQSRFWREDKSKDKTDSGSGTVFFHFSTKRGIAIFMPNDNRPFERYFLEYTRNQVKEAGSSSEKLPLPELLVKRMIEEKPNLSFSDTPSWFRKSDALSDEDWPFETRE
ncbi:MAG: serine/threonine protein kinase [Thermoguttaceae bacterium]